VTLARHTNRQTDKQTDIRCNRNNATRRGNLHHAPHHQSHYSIELELKPTYAAFRVVRVVDFCTGADWSPKLPLKSVQGMSADFLSERWAWPNFFACHFELHEAL